MADDKWLLLRGKLGGGVPDGTSPDIILGGAKPDPAYAKDYDKVFGQTGNFHADNHVYVRAKNASTDLAFGDVTVFVAYLTDLAHPGKWIRLHTSDGRSSTNIGTAAGGVTTNGVPLIWSPKGPPAQGAPFCLIAELSGDNFPEIDVPDTVTDQKTFDAWIATQPRLAYLIVKAPDVVVVPSPTFTWEGHVTLSNKEPVNLGSSLTCTSAPPGGTLAYLFSAKDDSGSVIGVGDTPIRIGSVYSQSETVPANFTSKVTITYKPGSAKEARADFTFRVTSELTVSGGDDDMPTTETKTVASYKLSFGQDVVSG